MRFMQHYRDEMEAFAWNQLERRNIDPMLRIIYKRFLTEDSMEAEQIKALYDICHAYEITTKVPNMKFIHVIARMERPRRRRRIRTKGQGLFYMQRQTGLCGKARMEDIIQILFHMKASACSMSFVTWISASGI